MKAGELATRSVATITPDASLAEAAHEMRTNHVGNLVVLEDEEPGRRPIGILTDRDLVMAIDRHGPEHFAETEVGSEMSESLILGKEGEPVEEILHNMRNNGIRRVPIIDVDDELVGILTLDDMLAYYGDGAMTMAEIVQTEISNEVTPRE